MTLTDLSTALRSITGFNKKVAYRAFPVGKAPKLPFICYLCTNTDNFFADAQVFQVIQEVDIELYTAKKDETSEHLVEAMLDENHLGWEKGEAKGRAEGRAEGVRAQAIESARLMKQHGDDINYIAAVTHLTPSEIEAL